MDEMRGMATVQILTVLEQRLLRRARTVDILMNGSTKSCGKHLNAAADAQHRNLAVVGQAGQ